MERKLEDVPETFHQVLSVLDFANENYILNIRHAFEMYTTGVRTDENRAVFVAHMQGVLNVVIRLKQDAYEQWKKQIMKAIDGCQEKCNGGENRAEPGNGRYSG